MSHTIIGKFFPIQDEDLEDTTEFLKQLGMTFHGGIDKTFFYIELKELPEILLQLYSSKYFDRDRSQSKKVWDVLKISEQGIALYTSSFSGGDAYVFLLMNNIISIHTVDQEFLDALNSNE